jgi:hypothetical protein
MAEPIGGDSQVIEGKENKEMQFKTTLGFYLTLVRLATIKNTKKQQMLVRMQGKKEP